MPFSGKRNINEDVNIYDLTRSLRNLRNNNNRTAIIAKTIAESSSGFRLVTPPETETSPGEVGDIALTKNYLYYCYETNKWSAIAAGFVYTFNN